MQSEKMKIFYRHFNLPPDFPLIGLLGPCWKSTGKPVTRMHFHNCLEIGLLYEGSGFFHINDEIVRCQAPCVSVVPPNVPHYTRAEEPDGECRWKWIYVDPVQLLPQFSPQLANELNHYQSSLSGESCFISSEEHPEILQLMLLIVDEMEKRGDRHHDIVRELMYAVFMMLLRISPDPQAKERRQSRSLGRTNPALSCIAPALNCIAENYMNNLTVEELSQLCHVSTSHFRRLFKQVIGWAPLEYLQIIRIDRACALLYNCGNSITEISLQVGYPSPSSFGRQFRHIYGMSPNQWRQKMRSEENPEVTAYFNSVPINEVREFAPMPPREGEN